MAKQEGNGPRSSAIVAVIALAAAAALLGNSAHAAKLIWNGDFETADFAQYKDKLQGGSKRSQKKLVTSPVRSGRYAAELTVFDSGNTNGVERAELLSSREVGGGAIKFKWDGPEYWVGLSFLFKDEIARTFTFFQLHAPNEPKGDKCDYAGNTFSVWGDGADSNGGKVKDVVVRVLDKGGVSHGKGAGSNNSVVHRYPFPLKEWQDYVVNFRLSTKGDGFYKIWKNDELIYSESGLTNVNYKDSCGKQIPADKRSHNGAHIGIYAPAVPGFRRIYYDEVKVAEGSDGYELVAPDNMSMPGDSEEGEPALAPPRAPEIVAE